MGNMGDMGFCRFCGQAIPVDGDLTAPERDEAATMACRCGEALAYQRKRRAIDKAKANIQMLFGEEARERGLDPIDNERLYDMLDKIAELIGEDIIWAATVKISPTVSAKLQYSEKSGITVTRTDTEKNQLG